MVLERENCGKSIDVFNLLFSSFQYRNQLSLQQDAKLHLQREALQQRQAELRSVDQRILELQGRLHKKKASNLLIQQNQQQNGMQPAPIHQNPMVVHVRSNSQNIYPSQRVVPRGNVVAVEPYNHTPQKSAITAIPSINKNNLNAGLCAAEVTAGPEQSQFDEQFVGARERREQDCAAEAPGAKLDDAEESD
jgi:hypothetical protein